jgi:hypothetical protein
LLPPGDFGVCNAHLRIDPWQDMTFQKNHTIFLKLFRNIQHHRGLTMSGHRQGYMVQDSYAKKELYNVQEKVVG